MITVGIELNNVIRNVNKQLLKYYQKSVNPSLEIDEIDSVNEDVLGKYIHFDSVHDKNQFIFIDYPYEIFGCASNVDKKFTQNFTYWLAELSNYEDEEIRVLLYTLGESELAIQSTFFYLSKIGTRVRKVIFPMTIDEVYKECDVVVTANNYILQEPPKDGKKIVAIARGFNEGNRSNAFLVYNSITELMEDKEFPKKISSDNGE